MRKIILIVFIFANTFSFSQVYNIKWNHSVKLSPDLNKKILNFDNCVYDDNYMPMFFKKIKVNNYPDKVIVNIKNAIFEDLPVKDLQNVDLSYIKSNKLNKKHSVSVIRKQVYINIYVVPIIYENGKYKRLISFELDYKIIKSHKLITKSANSYASNSVLSDGKWYKISVSKNGIYKISYDDLINMGFSTPISNIHIYGNGGKQLPYDNYSFRYDDLFENPIYINKGNDGIFNSGDYILFYGEGVASWNYIKYTSNKTLNHSFVHTLNNYADDNYYFVTVNSKPTKEITTISNSSTPNKTVTSFDDYYYHEINDINIMKTGRLWFGEHFDIVTNYTFEKNFSNLISTSPVKIILNVVARSSSQSIFAVTVNNQNIMNVAVAPISMSSYTGNYAANADSSKTFYSASGNFNIKISYNKPTSTSEGWLDYFILNVRRNLSMVGNQMCFRDTQSVGIGNISNFIISNSNPNIKVWDITNPVNPKNISLTYTSNQSSFITETDSLKQFIAFNKSGYLTPTKIGSVVNQNLHSLSNINYVIVSHPDFLTYANQLATFHNQHDGLSYVVVTPEQIYNEFSSGKPDVSAIRDFVKMLYEKAGNNTNQIPKYLLLFGDGSYDNKTNSTENTNYILTYQSVNSFGPTSSYVTDDFYGLLDSSDVLGGNSLDIGVGRFPVKTTTEAQLMFDKIKHYYNNSTMGDWRNMLCFIGDDEDSNQHMDQANSLANQVTDNYPQYNVDKILLDAFPQISTPTGEGYPEVTKAINNRVRQGALIINYTGHGNEIQLAHESILTISDILSWDNFDKMPVFVTATCEFSRYDDYERTSGGETILLNKNGGGIALFTTTRMVYSSPNFTLNQKFYNYAFADYSYKLGDLIRLAKNDAGATSNKLNFTLLGDPALKIAYPQYNVTTTKFNGQALNSVNDTLKALAKITIEGNINNNGNILTDFNGIIYPTIYDKPDTITTLSNDGYSPYIFTFRHNVLFKGKASVKNGQFKFSFIVPKDISYKYGKGKISYYTDNNIIDGNGYYDDFIIGGTSDSSQIDNQGPDIDLYMNNDKFVFGGITDEDPMILSFVSDSNGINTVGNGIGHDITAILDENTNNKIILNDFYQADLDSYQSGKIEYYLSELSEGNHTLRLKVWDVYNNSNEAYTEFIVAKSAELAIDHVLNYPNPFTTKTSFYFDHNQPNQQLDVIIQIFTISGKIVKTINTQVYSDGYRSNPINWDGLDDYGDRIGRGVYIYKINVRAPNGNIVNKFEKLVILR